jgi:NAD(P)-dependent dehydrogenase (short-subunit alcohol dehydrogenase family)
MRESAQRAARRQTTVLKAARSCRVPLPAHPEPAPTPHHPAPYGQNGRMDLGLDGRVYLVTGGSRGLGFAAAQALVAKVRELDALRGDPDEVRARLSEHIPLRRYGEPEEFGRAAAFVLSPAASYITGAMIPADGGAISSI